MEINGGFYLKYGFWDNMICKTGANEGDKKGLKTKPPSVEYIFSKRFHFT